MSLKDPNVARASRVWLDLDSGLCSVLSYLVRLYRSNFEGSALN